MRSWRSTDSCLTNYPPSTTILCGDWLVSHPTPNLSICHIAQVGHLYIVADQFEKNLMPVYNLGKSPPDSHLVTHDVSAPLWGPNMMTVDGQEKNFGQTSGEMEVM